MEEIEIHPEEVINPEEVKTPKNENENSESKGLI